MATLLLAAFALGYLLGSIPFGLLVAASQGVNIRVEGSGNIGATNVWRVMGRNWGLTTFACDFGKGLVAVLLAKMLAGRWLPLASADDLPYAGILAAIGCIFGHSFPVWLRFRGGKGVATSLGVIAGMMPLASASILLVWLIVLKLSRYVSMASLAGALCLPLFVLTYLFLGWMHGWAYFYFCLAATLLVVLRHSANIRRLLAGTESRIGAKPETTPTAAAEEAAVFPPPPP